MLFGVLWHSEVSWELERSAGEPPEPSISKAQEGGRLRCEWGPGCGSGCFEPWKPRARYLVLGGGGLQNMTGTTHTALPCPPPSSLGLAELDSALSVELPAHTLLSLSFWTCFPIVQLHLERLTEVT